MRAVKVIVKRQYWFTWRGVSAGVLRQQFSLARKDFARNFAYGAKRFWL